MKFALIIGDGMADYPIERLNRRTILEAADIPNMDWLAYHGKGGVAETIPPSMHPGSDVANMEILGYDTSEMFTGRAVFEALSMGIGLGVSDVAFRLNFVTLRDGAMKDYSAGHITSEESAELIGLLNKELGNENLKFFPGVSYRNIMICTGGNDKTVTIPPHDITGIGYEKYLPSGEGAEFLLSLMKKAGGILSDAQVNKKRTGSGKNPANSIWLWGQGRNLKLDTIPSKYGLSGSVISAVDLIKGIGIAAGLKPVSVPGATGFIDTNYSGKADYALKALEKEDFVFVHVEAPDEAGHLGDIQMKIKAVEDFDRLVVGKILENFKNRDDAAVMVISDHRTPIEKKTHTREPVPFAFYGPAVVGDGMESFSEKAAEKGSFKMIKGHKLLNLFIGDFASK